MPHSGYIIAPIVGALAIGLIVGNKDKLLTGPRASAPAATGALHGYLPLPKSSELVPLLPPPPEPGSEISQRDEEARRSILSSRTTARFALAKSDSVIPHHQQPIQIFSCSIGTRLSAQQNPALFKLMSRVRFDVRSAASVIEQHYQRTRPFVAAGGTPCSDDPDTLRASGSYPSAASGVGWTLASIMAELVPSRRQHIMARGFEYGQSRLVCDAVWESDVEAGRKLGDALLKRLRQTPEFQADLQRAKAELARSKSSALEGSPECKAEAVALAGGKRSVQSSSSS